MSASDWIAALALGVSIFALGFNAYHQYFKRAKVSIILGERVTLAYGIGRRYLQIMCPMTFLNHGAQYGVVTAIDGKISALDMSLKLRWWGFYEQREADKPDEAFKPRYEFGGWATSLIVPGREATTQWILFTSPNAADELQLAAGEFRLEFTGHVHPGETSARTSASFTLRSEDIKKVWDYVADELNRTPDSLQVGIRPSYGDRPGWLRPVETALTRWRRARIGL